MCGGQSGQGEADLSTPVTLVKQSFSEECTFCHGEGNLLGVEQEHLAESKNLNGVITGVTVTNTGGVINMTVNFRLFDTENSQVNRPVAGAVASSIRFTIAQLDSSGAGGVRSWQSYINRSETREAGDPGTSPCGTTAVQATAVQATAERASTTGGIFTDNGNGTYSYRFSFDFATVTTPRAVTYNAALTHRVAMQVSDNKTNAFLDFVPDNVTVLQSRDIVMNDSCNECHVGLAFHGGDRVAVEYCSTCHNPGSTDANSVDFKVMVHKIHRGEGLPGVEAGGEYAIWGVRNTKHDYSDVVMPQDIRNCTKCHDGTDADTPDGNNWRSVPSITACGSCHDNISFAASPPAGLTLHTGGAQADNSNCAVCHPASGAAVPPAAAGITDTHAIPAQVAASAPRFTFNIIRIRETDPGEFPVIDFSVTDQTNTAYDILRAPEFTAPAGASRLAILIGWDNAEHQNTGSQATPAQPVSINPLVAATTSDNQTFTVTSPVAIPAGVTGSGVVAMEGHPAVESVTGSGDYNLRVPVTGAVKSFAITDAAATERRKVVDVTSCNNCHGLLSLHGANRNNSVALCVICHNPNATDINRRPADPASTADRKIEETIDFKHMIHAIHAADEDKHGFRENGIVLYGFGGIEHDFSDVRYPGVLGNCEACHESGTFTIPPDEAVLPTTVSTAGDSDDPNDDKEITPVASVCSSCHDKLPARGHMAEEGARFDFILFKSEETTAVASGPSGTQPAGHTSRTDCASCH